MVLCLGFKAKEDARMSYSLMAGALVSSVVGSLDVTYLFIKGGRVSFEGTLQIGDVF